MASLKNTMINTVDKNDEEDKPKKFVPNIGRRQKRNGERRRSFKWPNSIMFNGNEIWASTKEPNFALYVLPKSEMNRKIIVTKEDCMRHLKKSN